MFDSTFAVAFAVINGKLVEGEIGIMVVKIHDVKIQDDKWIDNMAVLWHW